MSDQQHIAKELEELIRICRDGELEYREGAEHAKDPALKGLFRAVSLDRGRFAGDLEKFGARWGRRIDSGTDASGGALDSNGKHLRFELANDDAILGSIESSDERATQRYDEAIRDDETPEELVGILRNQAQAVVGTLDRIRALRERRKAA